MKFTSIQIELLTKLNILDQANAILDEYSEQYIPTKLAELIQSTRLTLQDKIFKSVHKNEFLNPYKLTTIDPINLQQSLKTMVDNGCEVVVIEISSQGLEQNRHWGIGRFDIGVFLNLYPEHIDSHGSFENYKNCKLKLFQSIKNTGLAVVNGSDQYSGEFLDSAPSGTQHLIVNNNRDYVINRFSNSIYKNFEVKVGKDTNKMIAINSFLMADFEISNAMIGARLIDRFILKTYKSSFDYNILKGNYFGVPGRLEWVVQENKIVFETKN